MEADIFLYIGVGFAAQMVDGAIGMAYGVVSTSVLLSLGISPAVASASVHAAEVFTTGASGLAHLYHRNVERRLFLRLVLPGCAGGAIGAYVLTEIPGHVMRPYVAAYLAIMGIVILRKALRPPAPREAGGMVPPLGFVGGLFDAIGGGGWGPIVASTLMARGSAPRYVIGSVNLAEFFVTVAASATFVASIGLHYTQIVLGLLIGGVAAAPLAAYVAKRLPAKHMMVLVAVTIMAVSAYTVVTALR